MKLDIDIQNIFIKVIENATSKHYWINKFKSLSYLDVTSLVLLTGFTLSRSAIDYRIERKNENHLLIESTYEFLNQFLDDVKDGRRDAVEIYNQYESSKAIVRITSMLQIITFRKYFKNEKFVNNLLDALRIVDERLKQTSLSESPNSIPIFHVYQEASLSNFTNSINALFQIRSIIINLLEPILKYYPNVPSAIVNNIVSLAMNKNVTFGIRRWMAVLLTYLATIHSNRVTLVNEHALTILKYYDQIQYPDTEQERESIKCIFDTIGHMNISKLFNNTKLSQEECQWIANEVSKYRNRFYLTAAIDSSVILSYTYSKTKSITVSVFSAAYICLMNKVQHSKIGRLFYFYGVILYVPNYTYILGYLLLSDIAYNKFLDDESPPKQFSDEQCDQLIPSIESIIISNIVKKKS